MKESRKADINKTQRDFVETNFRSKLFWMWTIFSAVILTISIFTLNDSSFILESFLSIAAVSSMLSIVYFECKVHYSLLCIFITEVILYIIGRYTGTITSITADLLFAIIGIFSGIYLVVNKLVKSIPKNSGKKRFTFKNIRTVIIKPMSVPILTKLMILGCLVTSTFTMLSMQLTMSNNLDTMLIVFTMLPTYISIFTLVPIKDTIFIRVVYYAMWIAIIITRYTGDNFYMLMIAEPLVYIASIIVGRLYTIGFEDPNEGLKLSNKSMFKNIDLNIKGKRRGSNKETDENKS